MNCPDCGSDIRLNFERGEKYCKVCGLVIEDLLPEQHHTKPENRVFQSPGITKAGGFMPNGAIVKASWMLTSKEKNMIKARKRLDFVVSKLNLPKHVFNDAYRLYKEAIYRDLSVGRDNTSLAYGCLYAACRINGIPKTPKEIVQYATTATQKDLLRGFRLIQEKLKVCIKQCDPVDFVHRYAAELNLSPKTITATIKLVEKIKKTNLFEGRHPESIIAAAIYLCCKKNKEPRTQREISGVVGVIEITIRKRFREIEKVLSEKKKKIV